MMNPQLKGQSAIIKSSLNNKFLRTAMDNFAVAYREGQKKVFSNLDKKNLVEEISSLKENAIFSVMELFEQFKISVEKKGGIVHYAETAADANKIIADIAQKKRCKNIVKAKSMTSEEILLNPYLESRGLSVTETDLGEWIIQLRKEGPSHMVMPAIHLSRNQVADLFDSVTQKPHDPENIEALVKVARSVLKEKFFNADMGITGANFLLADSGTAGIVTNEGNARLCSTLPDTHVILAGIDKILPGLKQALSILKVLPKNATGQAITSYVTWITGQGCKSRSNGKKDIHIVILDNGRTKVAKDPVFFEALKCVRCGACANVCPVYRMVGGHTMGHIYIGAIGLILTFLFHGKANASKLIGNCIGCGACKDICAAGIDLPEIIRETSRNLSKSRGQDNLGTMLSFLLKDRRMFHRLLKLAKIGQTPLSDRNGFIRHLPLMFFPDHNYKFLPTIAERSFRQIWENGKYILDAPKMHIAFFAGCLQDFVYPEHPLSFMNLLKKSNIQAHFPKNQSCCGLPLKMIDNIQLAEKIANENMNAFMDIPNDIEYDAIITLCASCALHLKKGYLKLFENEDDIKRIKMQAFSDKIQPSSAFIKGYINIDKTNIESPASFHLPCHLREFENAAENVKALIEKSGTKFIPASEENTCCGFGGSYSLKYPEISSNILDKKIEDFEKTEAKTIVTECPGCLLQLRGGIRKKGVPIKVKHIAELIARKIHERS